MEVVWPAKNNVNGIYLKWQGLTVLASYGRLVLAFWDPKTRKTKTVDFICKGVNSRHNIHSIGRKKRLFDYFCLIQTVKG